MLSHNDFLVLFAIQWPFRGDCSIVRHSQMTFSACRVCFQSHFKTGLRHGFGDLLMFQSGALCVSHANKSLRFLDYRSWHVNPKTTHTCAGMLVASCICEVERWRHTSLWDLMSHSEPPSGIAGSTPWRFPFGDHSFWYVVSWSIMQPRKDRTEVGEWQEGWCTLIHSTRVS